MAVRVSIHSGGKKINSIVVNIMKGALHIIDGLFT